MWNMLLEATNNGVISVTNAPDNIPDGIVYATKNELLGKGILIGFSLAIVLWIIIKFSIYLFKKSYNKNNEKEDD